ncbi:MAG TPA: MlaD family protein [Solirubrobacterales bacterium]|nr:MlaD family protein [Solirubrobacterales bacterium]
MRRLALMLALVAAGASVWAASVSADEETHTYRLEIFNAFGLVEGSEVKVAGVNSGTVVGLEVSEDKTALVEVELTGPLAVLGVDTQCSSEPQSLIAEYFIDCQPAGEPAEDGSILDKKVTQTVQPDLVQNTLRMPFKQRLAILINEFGTALSGNPENLNEAIRLGAPALEDLHAALRLLGRQNTVIRDLNVDSDRIISDLVERKEDVNAFIENAGEAAAVSAERREDLRTNFDLLDDFLAELQPTMVELENVARESTPLLADLRGAAPQLNELATSLPAFNRAGQASLVSLGKAAKPGTRALRRGVQQGTFEALADSGKKAPKTTELLADFARDIDDPRRIVEIDDRAQKTCEDDTLPCFSTGRKGPTGYTGMEGLLNYAYYQAGSTNQYDSVGHLLHFTLYDVFRGSCGSYNAQNAWPLPNEDPPEADGEGTTDITQAANCVSVLGPTQPGITESEESICAEAPAGQVCEPMFNPAVCNGQVDDGVDDNGVAPEDADLCNGAGPRTDQKSSGGAAARGGGATPGGRESPGGAGPTEPTLPELPGGGDLPVDPGDADPDDIRDILDDLPGGLGKNGKSGKNGDGGRGPAGDSGQAANDLLDFLFRP